MVDREVLACEECEYAHIDRAICDYCPEQSVIIVEQEVLDFGEPLDDGCRWIQPAPHAL
jgi:hypothetical protein